MEGSLDQSLGSVAEFVTFQKWQVEVFLCGKVLRRQASKELITTKTSEKLLVSSDVTGTDKIPLELTFHQVEYATAGWKGNLIYQTQNIAL